MTKEILTRLGKPPAFVTRVAWLVQNHMKFHYFANTGEGDVWKWLRKEALSHAFKDSASLSEAFCRLVLLPLATSGAVDMKKSIQRIRKSLAVLWRL